MKKSLGGAQEDARKEALKNSLNDEFDNEKHKHSLGNTVRCNKRKVLEKMKKIVEVEALVKGGSIN